MPAPQPAIQIEGPDLAPYRRGTSGIDYVHSFESGRPGPHVLLTALVHGNEICGAVALDRLLREGIRPLRGRLSLAFVNVAAYESFDPAAPGASRYVDEDFNRLWCARRLDGTGRSVELKRARELRPLVDSADLLLDIHSMSAQGEALLLAGPEAKGVDLARRVGAPATVIRDAGHAAGTRLRDYDGFADPTSPKNALLVECGQHWAKGTERVALDTCRRFLAATGAVAPSRAAAQGDDRPRPQRLIEITEAVTVRSHAFRFARPWTAMEVLDEGTLIATDGGREIRAPYQDCVLVMPSDRSLPGATAVRLGRRVA